MPITEINAHLKYRNSSGDTTVIYPITKAENIDGTLPITSGGTGASNAATARLNLGAAPKITYSTADISAGSTSTEADGTMHIVYDTNDDGDWDCAKSIFLTVNNVWSLIWSKSYPIAINLTGVSGVSSNPTTISYGEESAELTFTANDGYILPDTVEVYGATSIWDKDAGKLTLSNPKENVTINVVAEKVTCSITTNLTNVTGASSNPTAISYDEPTQLLFTASQGCKLPDAITVEGAEYIWDPKSGLLGLSKPTKNITITIVAETMVYSITTNLTGVSGLSSNPTTISYGNNVELVFTPNLDYDLPYVITVEGAGYAWDPESGYLGLSNPIGNVSVTITGIVSNSYITFSGDDGDFKIEATNAEWDGTIEYSTDKSNWSTWDGTSIESSNKKLYMRGSGNTRFFDTDATKGTRFILSDKAGCYGNLNALLDYNDPPTTLSAEFCYAEMFYNCKNLTHAPELPATTLTKYCYGSMFAGCTGLTQAPELPATTLSRQCYDSMFQGCTGLTQAPELPATTLGYLCYQHMFRNCTGLKQAPELPATILKGTCYQGMFSGCTGLTQAPELPATTLGNYCYSYMFYNCTGLTQAPELPATNLSDYCYEKMFYGCTGIKLSNNEYSTTDYPTAYRIPTSGTGMKGTDSLISMFGSTGGTFTDTPIINKTYYCAWEI